MKAKLIFLLALSFFVISNCFGQVVFQTNIAGAVFNSVKSTSDGGYILVGSVLAKTDSLGNVLWAKNINLPNYYSLDVYGGDATFDGGCVLAGGVSVDPNGSYQYTLRTNTDGDLLWAIGFLGSDYGALASSIEQTKDSGFIISGYTGDGSGIIGLPCAVLVKINKNGNVLWGKYFGYGGGNGETSLYGACAKQIAGGYIMCGYIATSQGAFLIRTDENGDTLWAKTYGGISSAAQQTTDSGFIMVGSIGGHVYLVKTNVNGDTLWTKSYGGTGTDAGQDVQQTDDGGYIVAGSTNSFHAYYNIYLIKTDSSGNVLWSKVYGGSGGTSVRQTPDGGYIICGGSLIVKTDANGNSCDQYTVTTTVGSPGAQIQPPDDMQYNGIGGLLSGADSTILDTVGSGTILCTNTSINELNNENTISLYPNPAANELNIKCGELRVKKIDIYNVLGQKATQPPILSPREEDILPIDVSKFVEGIYFVRIICEQGTWAARFVKE